MKTIGSGMSRTRFLIACVAITSLVSAANCDAQWGYRGSSTLSSRPAFRYQGPLLSFEVSPWYYGQDTSPYASSLYGRYRGVQPTQAELDRARFDDYLDRAHRYRTREDRYAHDFYNAYASPSAMVNQYRYPYVAGTPVGPWTPEPVPGRSIGRHQSRYQGYVPDDDVAIALRAAANRLQRSLSRKADGHIWIRHLKPDQIIHVIDHGHDPAVLTDLVVNYEGVAQTPRLVLIAETAGFQDVRQLLAQFVTLSSTYPGAEMIEPEAWQQPMSVGTESILEDRVIEERPIRGPIMDNPLSSDEVFEQGFSSGPQTSPGSLAPQLAPEPTPAVSPANAVQRSARPNLDSLPDTPDVELLPAPAPASE